MNVQPEGVQTSFLVTRRRAAGCAYDFNPSSLPIDMDRTTGKIISVEAVDQQYQQLVEHALVDFMDRCSLEQAQLRTARAYEDDRLPKDVVAIALELENVSRSYDPPTLLKVMTTETTRYASERDDLRCLMAPFDRTLLVIAPEDKAMRNRPPCVFVGIHDRGDYANATLAGSLYVGLAGALPTGFIDKVALVWGRDIALGQATNVIGGLAETQSDPAVRAAFAERLERLAHAFRMPPCGVPCGATKSHDDFDAWYAASGAKFWNNYDAAKAAWVLGTRAHPTKTPESPHSGARL